MKGLGIFSLVFFFFEFGLFFLVFRSDDILFACCRIFL